MNRDTIVFDVDGIMLDFNKIFVIFVKAKYNIDIPLNPNTWNFDWSGDSSKLQTYISEFMKTNQMLPLIDDSIVRFINHLKTKYKIVIVTAYNNKVNRINNLKLFDIYYDEIIFASQHNKVDIINSFEPIIVFEDCPMHINNLLSTNDKIVVYVPLYWNYDKGFTNSRVVYYDTFEKLLDSFSQYDLMQRT